MKQLPLRDYHYEELQELRKKFQSATKLVIKLTEENNALKDQVKQLTPGKLIDLSRLSTVDNSVDSGHLVG